MWGKEPIESEARVEPEYPKNVKGGCNFEVNPVRYKAVLQTAKSILKHEGISAFGKGVVPRIGINIPSTALSWGTYEIVKSFLAP